MRMRKQREMALFALTLVNRRTASNTTTTSTVHECIDSATEVDLAQELDVLLDQVTPLQELVLHQRQQQR